MDFATLTKNKSRGKVSKKVNMVKRASVGADLQHLDADKVITTDPRDYGRRRALKLEKRANSWGFTLQTYGIKHKRTNEVEIMTYVDYVEIGGAAWIAGMRAGDVIMSVNGERVDHLSHQQLVARIRQVQETLRLVVLFEDCCKKVELHERFLKLKAVLRSKYHELKDLEMKEVRILEEYCKTKGLNRFDSLRQSILSNVSSNSDSWDAYSMISSPHNLHSTGNYNQGIWSSVSSLKSFSVEDNNSSIAEEECSENYNYIDSESDSDSLRLTHGPSSDSDLPSNAGAESSLKVKNDLVLSSSDSNLYKGKSGRDPTHKKPAVRGPKKLEDDVFINGASDKGSNSNVISVPSADKGDNSNGAKEFTAGPETQIYYAGDNGNIIVPKIVIQGDEVFTTFDHINTKTIEEKDLPSLDPNSYREKVVALEIAREMALFENMNGVYSTDKTEIHGTFGLETKSPTSVRKSNINSEMGQENDAELPKLLPSIRKSNSLVNRETLSVLKKSPTLSTRSLTMNKGGDLPRLIGKYTGFSSSAPHVCGSLSYDQLKSSVPDFVISFHTDQCQVIYINEKDETTRL